MKIVKAFAALALVSSLSDRAIANEMPLDEPLYKEVLQLGYTYSCSYNGYTTETCTTYETDTFDWWWILISVFVFCACCCYI